MNLCSAPHPEFPHLFCALGYPHPEHQVWIDGEWSYWLNITYKPLVPTDTKLDMIKEMSRSSMATKMPVNKAKKKKST